LQTERRKNKLKTIYIFSNGNHRDLLDLTEEHSKKAVDRGRLIADLYSA